jgi:hypothetical protein
MGREKLMANLHKAQNVSITIVSGDSFSYTTHHAVTQFTYPTGISLIPAVASLFTPNVELQPEPETNADPKASRWACHDCQTIAESVGSSLALKPGEVALYDTVDGIAKAWSQDFANLGRDMNYMLRWRYERSR